MVTLPVTFTPHHVSHESNESMYNDRNEMELDNGTTARNNDKNECDDTRKEGEKPTVEELDDTEIGQV